MENKKRDPQCKGNRISRRGSNLDKKGPEPADYGAPLVTANNFAYYVCGVPFRLRRLKDGSFTAATCRFQTILWLLMAAQALYYCVGELYIKYMHALKHRDASSGDAVAHIRLFCVAAGAVLTIANVYLNTLRVDSQVAFVNKLVRFSKGVRGLGPGEKIQTRQIKYWNAVSLIGCFTFYTGMVLIPRTVSIATASNEIIQAYWRTLVVWFQSDRQGDMSGDQTGYLVQIVRQITCQMHLWCIGTYYMCVTACNAAWLLVFVVISCDFSKLVNYGGSKTGARIVIRKFMDIRKLLFRWDSIFGVSHASGILYYLLVISEFAAGSTYQNDSWHGSVHLKIFTLFSLLAMMTEFFLAVLFAEKMKRIQSLLGLPIMCRREYAVIHSTITNWTRNSVCCIRGRMFPINYHTVFHFTMTTLTILFLRSTPSC